jgi:hypothetical protein
MSFEGGYDSGQLGVLQCLTRVYCLSGFLYCAAQLLYIFSCSMYKNMLVPQLNKAIVFALIHVFKKL